MQAPYNEKELLALIDDHCKFYENGTITISDDIEFSNKEIVKRITHFVLSRHWKGQKDELQRLMPFKNIGNAIVDLEWRAKNIDRSAIEATAVDGDYAFSIIVNRELQQWMRNNNFGKTIDDYQRKKSEYGNVMLKRTETEDELKIDIVQWNNIKVDPRDIDGGLKVEPMMLTPLELIDRKGTWDSDAIDLLLEKTKKERKSGENRVEVWDCEGQFENSLFEEDAEGYALYNVVLGVYGNKKCLLFHKKLPKTRYKFFKRKEVEDRDWGMGVWEEVFEPQIWTNEAEIARKFALDLAGKVIGKTNKKTGVTSFHQLRDGELIYLADGETLEPLQLQPSGLDEYQQVIDGWFLNMQRDQSAFAAVTGSDDQKANTPFAAQALQASQAASIFNKRRDQDGFDLNEVLMDWVLPFVVKQINKAHKLTASFSKTELRIIDDAIRAEYANERIADKLLKDFELPSQEDQAAALGEADIYLNKFGSTRTIDIPDGYITVKKIKEKVRFDITDEMMDSQRRLNALAVTLQALAPEDPNRVPIIQEMMEISGISPVSFPVAAAAPQSGQAPRLQESRVEAALPEGQKV